MATDEPDYVRLLTGSLEILGADPQVQIAFIDKPGLSADDLAEDHVAPARNAEWMHEEGLISLEVRTRAERIDELFTAMSGASNAERWTHLALQTDPGWAKYEPSLAKPSRCSSRVQSAPQTRGDTAITPSRANLHQDGYTPPGITQDP